MINLSYKNVCSVNTFNHCFPVIIKEVFLSLLYLLSIKQSADVLYKCY